MRESLKRSAADTPARGFERYQKGSIILCNACAKPLFKLDRGIDIGAKAGRAADAFKPLSMADLEALAQRVDIDAGVRAMIWEWTGEERAAHLAKLHEMRAGDPMLCPACHECFAQVLSTEVTETLEKAYTVELLAIPPEGAGHPAPVRGKHLGAGPGKDWIHEQPRGVQ